MEEVAFDWLKRYPDSLKPLPPRYRAAFPEEPDINMNLRVYLAHMYLHLVSDVFDWPDDYRYARVQELMAPLLEEKQYLSIEEVDAKVWFASRCSDAGGMYMGHMHRAVEKGELDEEMLSVYATLCEAEAAVNRARLYETVAAALENAAANPEEYHRLVSRSIPEDIIIREKQSVARTALDCRRVADKAREKVADLRGGPGAQLLEGPWKDLLDDDDEDE